MSQTIEDRHVGVPRQEGCKGGAKARLAGIISLSSLAPHTSRSHSQRCPSSRQLCPCTTVLSRLAHVSLLTQTLTSMPIR
ncbi:hypothetical protein CALVIDRAFT_46152 [Calocera viscosa TUFC12733]|uniref:Uncharacterized protein n=1 Tax=Calocera viscosa (strain TUFC12733) TaxID=1330018 RepID=A0A167P4Y0_CALVF|nr:hypothetical protein CALVIDRAFT_46152 [Calocera viscosa TUFC12733]